MLNNIHLLYFQREESSSQEQLQRTRSHHAGQRSNLHLPQYQARDNGSPPSSPSDSSSNAGSSHDDTDKDATASFLDSSERNSDKSFNQDSADSRNNDDEEMNQPIVEYYDANGNRFNNVESFGNNNTIGNDNLAVDQPAFAPEVFDKNENQPNINCHPNENENEQNMNENENQQDMNENVLPNENENQPNRERINNQPNGNEQEPNHYREFPMSHPQLRNLMQGNYSNIITTPVGVNTNDLLYMILGMSKQNNHSNKALNDAVLLINTIFNHPVLPTSSYLLDNIVKNTVGVTYYFYCRGCTKLFGSLDFENIKEKVCESCTTINVISDLRSAHFFCIFDFPCQLQALFGDAAVRQSLMTPAEILQRVQADSIYDIYDGSEYRRFALEFVNALDRVISLQFCTD